MQGSALRSRKASASAARVQRSGSTWNSKAPRHGQRGTRYREVLERILCIIRSTTQPRFMLVTNSLDSAWVAARLYH